MNKYGGINDAPLTDKCVYNLWYQMLRRCYDQKQWKRSRGKSYANCNVSDRWKYLSKFANDIKYLDGYRYWENGFKYCLDKDTTVSNNKIYGRDTCRFIPCTVNIRDVSKRHPHITENANKANQTRYMLIKGDKKLIFDSEKEACKYLGVVKCSVSSCYHKGYKCKGYTIAKMDLEGEK